MSLLLLCNRRVYLAPSFAEKVLDNTLSVNLKLSFRPTNNFFIACPANNENATASRTNSNLELRSSGALANCGTQPGLIHMKLFSFGP
jgi:hypothetical protein